MKIFPSGILTTAQVDPNVDQSTGISVDTMRKYLKYQLSGKYNMIMDGRTVAKLMGISSEQYLELLRNYDRLLDKWPELEETGI